MPISALKSYTGHTLGACGALEAWVTLDNLTQRVKIVATVVREIDAALLHHQGLTDGGDGQHSREGQHA